MTKAKTAVKMKSRTDDQVRSDQDKIISRKDLTEDEKGIELQREPIRQALADNEVNAELTFPTRDTWQLFKNGKTDSGNLSVPIDLIVQKAMDM